MASDFAVPVSASQIGSHFVQQYYHILQQQPDQTHRFYNDASSVELVDGEITKSASGIAQIYDLIMSLQLSSIEIKTINAVESWNDGVFMVVSGSVKSENFTGRRKFVQSFFLAPQVGGYFVLNDIFHLLDEEVVSQAFVCGVSEVASEPPTPVAAADEVDPQPTPTAPHEDAPVHAVEDEAEAEARAHVESNHVAGDHAVEDYTFQDNQQNDNSVHETVEKNTLEEPSEIVQNAEDSIQEPLPSEEKPVGEASKPSYASILRVAGGQPRQTVRVVQPVMAPQHPVQQLNPVPSTTEVVTDESFSLWEGHSKSIYVRNLPSSVSTLEVLEEFKNFGRVKQDGVYLVNNKGAGVCYAFVEFEDVQSAQSAIKASPIKLAGRQVYIEMRKSNSYSGSGGGRTARGRGRGGRFGGRSGRRSLQEGTEINRVRSNGFLDT